MYRCEGVLVCIARTTPDHFSRLANGPSYINLLSSGFVWNLEVRLCTFGAETKNLVNLMSSSPGAVSRSPPLSLLSSSCHLFNLTSRMRRPTHLPTGVSPRAGPSSFLSSLTLILHITLAIRTCNYSALVCRYKVYTQVSCA